MTKRLLKKLFLQKSNFVSAVKLLFIFDNLGKIAVFFRSVVITAVLGFSRLTDLYYYLTSIFSILFGVISDAMTNAIVPFIQRKETKKDKLNFVNSTFFSLLVLLGSISIIFIVFYPNLMNVLAPGIDQMGNGRLFVSAIATTCIIKLFIRCFDGYLRAEEIFGMTSVSNLINGLLSLLLLLLFLNRNSTFIVIAPLLSSMIAVILYLYIIPKQKFTFDKEVFTLFSLSLPLVFGGGLSVLNNFIDKWFASGLDEGTLTVLSYGFLIVTQVRLVINGPIAAASSSFFTSHIINKNYSRLQQRLNNISDSFCSLFTLLLLGFLLVGQNGLEFMFYIGNADLTNVNMLFKLTGLYFPMIYFSAITSVSIFIFFANNNTFIPALAIGLSITINIVLNFLFVRHFGAYALCISTAFAAVVYNLILVIYAKIKYKLYFYRLKHYFIVITLSLYVPIYSLNSHSIHFYINFILAVLCIIYLFASGMLNRYTFLFFKKKKL